MNNSRYLLICMGLALAACGLDPNAPEEPSSDTLGNDNTTNGNGTGSSNTAEACQELEDTLAACVPSLAGTMQCSSYDGWPCDLTAYFDCVTDAYGTCSGGTFPDIDPLTLQDCAALSVCE